MIKNFHYTMPKQLVKKLSLNLLLVTQALHITVVVNLQQLVTLTLIILLLQEQE